MKFNILCIDPPFSFVDRLAMSDVKRGADANYTTMTQVAIKQLKVGELAAQDAVLALWVPSSLLSVGLEIMEAYNFKQKQTWIWVKTKKNPLESLKKELKKKAYSDFNQKRKTIDIKDVNTILNDFDLNNMLNFGLGHISRNVHELALIGTRGKVNPFIKNKSQRTVFFDQNYRHSQKPEILQDRLELIFPDFSGHACEIFARRERPGWTCIGNEVSTPAPNMDIVDAIEHLIKIP